MPTTDNQTAHSVISHSAPECLSVDEDTWHYIERFAEKLAPHSAYSASDLQILVEDGRMMAWAIVLGDELRGAIFLELHEMPSGSREVVVIGLAGVGMDDWYEGVMDTVVAYASHAGASSITAVCRPGMARKLSTRGWGKIKEVMQYGR